MLYHLVRQLLFRMPEEASHNAALTLICWAEKCAATRFLKQPDDLPVKVMGLDFKNPVGLAAGLDKNGDCIDGLGALGFGFLEVGTVTPRPQPGNPMPRLFRLPRSRAIINRMGFNNKGIDYLVRQVESAQYQGVLGINIGKNLDTPVEQATSDYLIGLQKAYPVADYIVVNISSPNTKGLRSLQSVDALRALLMPLKEEQDKLATRHSKYVPLVVKIAPDLEDDDINAMAECFVACRVDAISATNTTIFRPGLEEVPGAKEQGGLSGLPLRPLALAKQKVLVAALDGRLPVIGVGGIMTGQDAAERIAAGARLVQLYSGFIYSGPALIRDAVTAIAAQPHVHSHDRS